MIKTNPFINIALLQLNAEPNNQKLNLEIGDHYCRQAKKLGADIALFPEMFNIGYTPFHPAILQQDFSADHLITYGEAINQWKYLAISQNSYFIKHFQHLAKELNMAISITYLRKGNRSPRNSLSLIDRSGNILFTYDKVHTCDFSREAICEPGDQFFVGKLNTEKGDVDIGAMICYDREFPESAGLLMLGGAEIILTPNACEMEENRLCQFKTRAFDNMVGVALANYAAPQNNGHSCAFDGIAFNHDGSSRNTCIVIADEKEGVFIAAFNIEKIRAWRKNETWGNAYRKPTKYQSLVSLKIREPFIRHDAKR
ncbi:MAG: carbon-nitrogen hydrolase family protein [Candidatus Rickettsiella isopodorum]|nr:carbon-nitrogen hydrolase family protein [Candidatus Rickettsiella isopodorum]MDD5162292.1 carbon-nitrogen hydrolase family protein [Candidatus Rickettsiella isopodorum]